MEIIPTFIQTPSSVEGALVCGAIACVALFFTRALTLLPVGRLTLRVGLRTLLSATPLPILLASGFAIAKPSSQGEVASPQRTRSEIPPALDERVPPLRSLVGAGGMQEVHPAIHPHKRSGHDPLFPRARRGVEDLEPWERGALDLRRRRSSGRTSSREQARKPDHHTVLPGDTLWDIAANVLETDDQRAIARFWPAIHKANVDVIGRDPNLLRPGQVLYIPRKEEV